MSGDMIATAGYLTLLGVVLAAGLWTRARNNLSRTLQHVAIWFLIFVGAIAAVGLWQDMERHMGGQSASADGSGQITVPRSRDGHYYLTLEINGENMEFVVDTGATDIVLNRAAAERAGIDTDQLAYVGRASTANGVVETAYIRLETITLGEITDTNVAAVVTAGEMREPLLGMGYLQRWGRIEIAGDQLTLTR
ncbi:MAG: aspartyl protease family protein [Ascidiaceihabitans sp.]|jgi:aspartyl protease family protein